LNEQSFLRDKVDVIALPCAVPRERRGDAEGESAASAVFVEKLLQVPDLRQQSARELKILDAVDGDDGDDGTSEGADDGAPLGATELDGDESV
jgi:hypothetical protein